MINETGKISYLDENYLPGRVSVEFRDPLRIVRAPVVELTFDAKTPGSNDIIEVECETVEDACLVLRELWHRSEQHYDNLLDKWMDMESERA